MKYKDPITGELRDVIIKSGDTLPIGTIVDFDGDIIPDGYEEATEASDVVNSLEGNEIYRAPSVKAVNEVLNGEKSMGSIVVEDVTCKNLFNKNSVLKGYELQNSDGSAATNSDWFVSDYIEIEPNKDYYLSGGRTRGTTNAFYDSEKNYLGHISALSGKITSLDNAKFVRFNGQLNELDSDIQFETGKVKTNYVEHKDFDNTKHTLYENLGGTESNITLNDDINNYKEIEIFFRERKNYANSTKVRVEDANYFNLSVVFNDDTYTYIVNKNISISGAILTAGKAYRAVFGENNYQAYQATNMSIYKVVGYK